MRVKFWIPTKSCWNQLQMRFSPNSTEIRENYRYYFLDFPLHDCFSVSVCKYLYMCACDCENEKKST